MKKFIFIKSFRMKLLFIIWIGSTATLFLACGCFIFYEVARFDKDLIKEMKIISSFIADKSTQAIMFNDPAIAEDALLSVAATDPAVVNAAIYDAEGNVVATYGRDIPHPEDFDIPEPQQNTTFFKDSHLHLFSDIDMYSDHLGCVYIRADRHVLYKRMQSYGIIVAGIMAVSLLFIAVISFLLQKLVATPVMALIASAKHVSEKKDYSIRVKKHSEDELGVLADAFNEMLSQIQKRDISLRESEAKTRALLNGPSDSIYMFDPNGIVLDANETALASLSVSREELIGSLIWNYFSQEVTEKRKSYIEELVRTGNPFRFEDEREGIWFDNVIHPIFDDQEKVVQIAVIARNITDRKRTEEELHESEFLFRSQFDHGNIGIAITSVDKGWMRVNAKLIEMFGYSEEEMRSKTWAEMTYPDDLAPDLEQFQRLLDNEIQNYEMDKRFFRKDGEIIYTHLSVACYRNQDHSMQFAIASLLDITAHKRIEEEREKLETQLRQAQKMEAVGQLAGGVAHDFNNLLQAILGYGDLAMDEAGANSPARESVEEILKAGHRAKTLVSQLLAFSRQQVLDMTDINLNDVIADLMKMIRRVIGEHISLEFISGHELGIVRADRGQIEQILMNLCVNARDAMLDGGSITIETENVRIDDEYCNTHTWAEQGSYVILSFTDTGCGMDENILTNIFEPFFTTKGVGKGTGLGLATVYGLVKQHQGLIHVYSEVSKGTTFKIYLPVVERSAATVGDKIEGPVPRGTETILLAEDDEMVRTLTKTILEHVGYTVLVACDGEEALSVFEEHHNEIDMALLDVMMPKLGGRAVFERIREKRPHVRVLFASGYSMNEVHTNFVLDEGLQLIQKPYQREDLLRGIRQVLEG